MARVCFVSQPIGSDAIGWKCLRQSSGPVLLVTSPRTRFPPVTAYVVAGPDLVALVRIAGGASATTIRELCKYKVRDSLALEGIPHVRGPHGETVERDHGPGVLPSLGSRVGCLGF